MRKVICLTALVALAACTNVVYRPYDGQKVIVGNGGFFQEFYSAKDLGVEKEYPNGAVELYASGLPVGAKCTLIGYSHNNDRKYLARTVLDVGGNVATQSSIISSVPFENGEGQLDTSHGAGNMTVHTFYNTGASSITYYGYHIFNCI